MNTTTPHNNPLSRVCDDAQREIDALLHTVEARLSWAHTEAHQVHVDLDTQSLEDYTDDLMSADERPDLPVETTRALRTGAAGASVPVAAGIRFHTLVSLAVSGICDFFDAGPLVERRSTKVRPVASDSRACVRTHKCLVAAARHLTRELFTLSGRGRYRQ